MEQKLSQTIQLNDGTYMPRVGLGTHAVDGCAEIVYQSIKDGVRLFDTASKYGTETEVGKGVARAISEGIVNREDLYIVTKLWITEKHEPEAAIKRSLEKLGLEYIDLYFEHVPANIYKDNEGKTHKVPLHVLWGQMEDLVKKGYTKSIGISNYNVQNMVNLLSFCEIKPVANTFEVHPYLPEENLIKFCKEHDIVVMAYNSLCRGTYAVNSHVNLLEEEVIKSVAEKYNTTPGNVALNWALAQDMVVIPATSNPKRMSQNLKALEFRLTEKDLSLITKTLNKNIRFNHTVRDLIGYDIFA